MRFLVLCALSVALTACSKKSERVYTVDELLTNEPLRTETIEKCRNNPGELASTPNCRNAEAADGKARLERMQKSLGG